MRRILIAAFVAATLALAGTASPAFASLGVGTDTGKITIEQPIVAGGTYPLRQFAILNAGDGPYGYGMKLVATPKKGMMPDSGWFRFDPATFYLYPKQSITVHTTIHVSADATPGAYVVQLAGSPRLAKTKTAGGFLNVAAGPVLTFTVVQPNPWQRLYFGFLDLMPWSAIAAALLVVLIGMALWLALRRRALLASVANAVPKED